MTQRIKFESFLQTYSCGFLFVLDSLEPYKIPMRKESKKPTLILSPEELMEAAIVFVQNRSMNLSRFYLTKQTDKSHLLFIISSFFQNPDMCWHLLVFCGRGHANGGLILHENPKENREQSFLFCEEVLDLWKQAHAKFPAKELALICDFESSGVWMQAVRNKHFSNLSITTSFEHPLTGSGAQKIGKIESGILTVSWIQVNGVSIKSPVHGLWNMKSLGELGFHPAFFGDDDFLRERLCLQKGEFWSLDHHSAYWFKSSNYVVCYGKFSRLSEFTGLGRVYSCRDKFLFSGEFKNGKLVEQHQMWWVGRNKLVGRLIEDPFEIDVLEVTSEGETRHTIRGWVDAEGVKRVEVQTIEDLRHIVFGDKYWFLTGRFSITLSNQTRMCLEQTGEFLEGLMDGEGQQVLKSEDYLVWKKVGFFKNGLLNGPGKIQDGSWKQKGEFLNGVLHGLGKLVKSEMNTVHKGYFEAGNWIKGTVEFRDDHARFVGRGEIEKCLYIGVMTYFGEFRIEGEFCNTIPWKVTRMWRWDELVENAELLSPHTEGLKTAVGSNLNIYVGKFVDGYLDGEGEIYNESGRYRGQVLSNLPHGRGTWNLRGGAIVSGEYLRGKLIQE